MSNDRVRDPNELIKGMPGLASILESVEKVEKNTPKQIDRPYKLPYASPPMRSESTWKKTKLLDR